MSVTSTLSITIAGNSVIPLEDTIKISQKLGERWDCTFTVSDLAGTAFYSYGQRVVVTDSTLGVLFSGFIATVKQDKTQTLFGTATEHQITCVDNRHLADKRTSNLLYTNPTYAGKIVTDMVSTVLAAEGVQASYAVNDTATKAQWATGTLTNTVATNNVGDGDLELLGSGGSVSFTIAAQADWAANGTLSHVRANSGGDLSLIGSTRNWNNGSVSGQTLYGNGSPTQGVTSGVFNLTCTAMNETRSRLDFAGQWADFTATVDAGLGGIVPYNSLVYRTTGWSNTDATYAYAIEFNLSRIQLMIGSNGGANNPATLALVNISPALSPGTYTLKVVVSGNNHQISLNDTQYINYTQSGPVSGYGPYTAAGSLAIRNRNLEPYSLSQNYDNFGVMQTTSGTWTGTAVSVNAVSLVNSSIIKWDQSLSQGGSVTVQTSVDGGSTYQTCSNGGAIPKLGKGTSGTGKSVIVKVTLSTGNAGIMPDIQKLTWNVQGGYISSGTRVSPSFDLSPVGRVGSSSVSWNANVPPNTSLGIDVSPDGSTWTDMSAQNGAPIPFINNRPAPTVDAFGTNTSANYQAGSLATDGDSFAGRTVASGWGTASSGHVWSLVSGSGTTSVSSGKGLIASTSSPVIFQLGSITILDGAVSVRIQQGNTTNDILSVFARYQDANNWYAVVQNGQNLLLQKKVTGTVTTLATTPFATTAAFFWLELDVSGTALSAYAWADGTARPGTALLTATDSTFSSGFYGLGATASTSTACQFDTFNTTRPGATWTYDTPHSRIAGTGGTLGVYLNNAISWADIDVLADMDRSDAGGLVWRYNDPSDCYYLVVADNLASAGTPNTLTLNKLAGVVTTQLTQTPIAFVRGSYHRIRVTMLGGVITVLFDGTQAISYTDGSPLGAGLLGLFNNGGTVGSRYYQLWIQPQGDTLAGVHIYTRQRLATTDTTVTPQVFDVTVAAYGPAIDNGILIPSANYQNTFVDKNLDDLGQQSNISWYLDQNKTLFFNQRLATPAPWILSSNTLGLPSDIEMDSSLVVDVSGDLYRNRQTLTGVTNTGAFTNTFIGDGSSTSFTLGYPVAPGTVPVITLNGGAQKGGVKGSSGSDWYYAAGDAVLQQDNAGTKLISSDTLSVAYTGTFITTVTVDNTAAQTALAAISGDSGIVEAVLDVSSPGMQYAAALTYANQLLLRYCISGRTLTFVTYRDGLQIGQLLPVFITEENLSNVQMLIHEIDIGLRQQPGGVLLYSYLVTASELPVIASWKKLLAASLLNV